MALRIFTWHPHSTQTLTWRSDLSRGRCQGQRSYYDSIAPASSYEESEVEEEQTERAEATINADVIDDGPPPLTYSSDSDSDDDDPGPRLVNTCAYVSKHPSSTSWHSARACKPHDPVTTAVISDNDDSDEPPPVLIASSDEQSDAQGQPTRSNCQ
eukprot:3472197-Rhodomonas_salina.1